MSADVRLDVARGDGPPPPAPVFTVRSPGERRLLAALSLVAISLFSCAKPLLSPSSVLSPRPASSLDSETTRFLDDLEHRTFRWFWDRADPVTGLVPDRAPTQSFSSVAAVGFGLTAYVVGAERGWLSREQAAERVAKTLRFLRDAPAGTGPSDATGYRGFFYHFLDMKTGRRFKAVELSTIDSALLFAGALTCAGYFDRNDGVETGIRSDADFLYRRAEWEWASPRPPGVSMGWTPEEGFHGWNWHGYNEAMILYVLALGSPTHPADSRGWNEFVSTYRWGTYMGETYINFSPLFGYQYSHVWIDFRGIRDRYLRDKGIDYFENSRRATYAHRRYAIENPSGYAGYGSDVWGLTACDGPADVTLTIRGKKREFHGYAARGASLLHVIDDGTLAPTAAAASIPFAPEIVVPALAEMKRRWRWHIWNDYGFVDAFNPTIQEANFPSEQGWVAAGVGWFDRDQLGIDQGPILAMIENYRSELLWRILRKNPYVVAGLKRAGFAGGWLETAGAGGRFASGGQTVPHEGHGSLSRSVSK